MRPEKADISELSREQIAEKYSVSDKTVVRWLKHHGLYERKITRLSKEKAREIRDKYLNNEPVKFMAEDYGVTVSTIYRIVNQETYPSSKDSAAVSVSYNP